MIKRSFLRPLDPYERKCLYHDENDFIGQLPCFANMTEERRRDFVGCKPRKYGLFREYSQSGCNLECKVNGNGMFRYARRCLPWNFPRIENYESKER